MGPSFHHLVPFENDPMEAKPHFELTLLRFPMPRPTKKTRSRHRTHHKGRPRPRSYTPVSDALKCAGPRAPIRHVGPVSVHRANPGGAHDPPSLLFALVHRSLFQGNQAALGIVEGTERPLSSRLCVGAFSRPALLATL